MAERDYAKLLIAASQSQQRPETNSQKLNTRILNEHIEKIVVHEKGRDEAGTVTQQVDIYCKFIGYIDPRMVMEGLLYSAGAPGETGLEAIIAREKAKKIAQFRPL